MGSVRDVKEVKHDEDFEVRAFCNDVYTELAGMRMKILMMSSDLAATYGEESRPLNTYKRHLTELADQIEWKLQILSHACPYDWKGSTENIETIVSVKQPDTAEGPDFSGGYLGG
jgi:hypothetical protein